MEYQNVSQGPTMTLTADGIEIDGKLMKPITVINAACRWEELAKERGWTLTDSRGLKIDATAYLEGFQDAT